jgi:altronate hydrolase
VHVHNLGMANFERDYAFGVDYKPTEFVATPATFMGIKRADGRVATRNYVAIISSVNCSAHVSRKIAEYFTGERVADYPNVDGVFALTHQTGCGMASTGEPVEVLRRVLAGYATHPNVASCLMIGLGCEANQINDLLAAQGLKRTDQLQPFTIQDTGGTRKTIQDGIARIKELLPEANKVKREPCPASHLILGLECGGSDGYSGISANPALGAAADLLVKHGGTAVLSETPEIYGAEHLLTRRAVSRTVGEKLIERIRWWEDYTSKLGGDMNNNPSPGNKAGGLTTILEKSLGAAAKGGTTGLMDVYKYAERMATKGFVFMDTPGYDPVSVTGQVAGGANIVCFTTGRGSAYGCKPSPSLKLATNSALWDRQEEDMDINCGVVVDGKASVEEVGRQIFELILKTASGQPSKSEIFGYGDDEFAPWVLGPTM